MVQRAGLILYTLMQEWVLWCPRAMAAVDSRLMFGTSLNSWDTVLGHLVSKTASTQYCLVMQGAAIVTNCIKAETERMQGIVQHYQALQNFFPKSIARHALEYTQAQKAGAKCEQNPVGARSSSTNQDRPRAAIVLVCCKGERVFHLLQIKRSLQ